MKSTATRKRKKSASNHKKAGKRKPRVNSRKKGKVAELALAKWLRGWTNGDGSTVEAARGKQYQGSPDSPDIRHSIPGIHIECTWREDIGVEFGAEVLRAKFEQACQDYDHAEQEPVVIWRRNNMCDGLTKKKNGWRITRSLVNRSVRGYGDGVLYTADFAHWMVSNGYRRIEKKTEVPA